MFFKQNAFVCCVRNKYHCAITKFPAYLLPIKEKLMCRFLFPHSVCIFFFFTNRILFLIFFFLCFLWKISPSKRKFLFISNFFSFWAFFSLLIKIYPSQLKFPPEPCSGVRTFSAPLLKNNFPMVLNLVNTFEKDVVEGVTHLYQTKISAVSPLDFPNIWLLSGI